MLLDVTEEVIAHHPPQAQAIIRALLAHIMVLEKRVAELEDRLGKSPQNSSLPPSAKHPHAKPPAAKPISNRNRDGQPA
jgi:hypothetical protein